MLRGAIIGFGNIALRGHLPAYLTGEHLRTRVHIGSVVDVVEQNRQQASTYLPGAKSYSSLESLLEEERPDFVDVCSPPSTHLAYIRSCCSNGINIICEKPLTESLMTAEAASGAIRKSGIIFVPCHQYKYSPLWSAIRDRVKSGALGRPTLAQFNVFRLRADVGSESWSPAWRTNRSQSGGGILVDTGAHYFYLAQHIFGMPCRISAVTRTLKHAEYGVEDTAAVTLEYDHMLLQINLTWAASHRANNATVIGTEGSLVYDGASLRQSGPGGSSEIPMPDVSDKQEYVRWYSLLFDDFVRRVQEQDKRDDLIVEALNVMRLLDLSYRSSEERKTISVA